MDVHSSSGQKVKNKELHKQTVRRACWRWCFSHQHRPAARQPVPREGFPDQSGQGSEKMGSGSGNTRDCQDPPNTAIWENCSSHRLSFP